MWPALKTLLKRAYMHSAGGFGTITHVATDEPVAALTFDDGPEPTFTPRLLEILERHGARGTFFMVGLAASRQRELVERVARGGHAIGNHSWDHVSFPLLRSRWRRLQIRWCEEVLAPHGRRLFRPPWGHQNLASHLDALRLGYRVVTWNLMAEDWADDSAEVLAERVLGGLRPGSIVLFHDALFRTHELRCRDREPTLRAVEILLAELAGRYRFVTVPELLRLGRPRRWHWYKPSDLDWLRKQV
jgi:peptidoglycan-N-acetylglucosamine deacetylase